MGMNKVGSLNIDQLLKMIEQRCQTNNKESVRKFAELFFKRSTAEEMLSWKTEDLFGSTINVWEFIQELSPSQPKVVVYNPEYNRDGWEVGHTVICALSKDMPFLVDSLRGVLHSRGIAIHSLRSILFSTKRKDNGELTDFYNNKTDGNPECLIYFEIDSHTNSDDLNSIKNNLQSVLSDVDVVVKDFLSMKELAQQSLSNIKQSTFIDDDLVAETTEFINWLCDDHYTFLGYERLAVSYDKLGNPQVNREEPVSLGITKSNTTNSPNALVREIKAFEAEELQALPVIFTKSSNRATVHRRVYPDIVSVREFDEHGRISCQHCFIGMYTSSVYNVSPTEIPLVRDKYKAVMENSGYLPGSHAAKDLAAILEFYPRDELIESPVDTLFNISMGVNHIQERGIVKLYVRHSHCRDFVNCLVYLPRDIYHTDLRQTIEQRLCEAYEATESEFNTYFSESVLIRTHFVLRVDPEKNHQVDTKLLEQEIINVTMSWDDHIKQTLREQFGDEQGLNIAKDFSDAFSPGYMDDFDPRVALSDIQKIKSLKSDDDIAMGFSRRFDDADNQLRFRLIQRNEEVALSDVMPILENLGLRVLGESPYRVTPSSGAKAWVHEFRLEYSFSDSIDLDEVAPVFEEAFSAIWFGKAESDAFNRLIIGAGMNWRFVAMLRAYARYMKQIRMNYSEQYIAETLSNHTKITRLLVDVFKMRLDPALNRDKEQRLKLTEAVEQQIIEALDSVSVLNEDKIIRQYLALVNATLRTNYFQTDDDGELKSYFSFKLDPSQIPDVPLPLPMFEIFVYSPRVEGVHLRGGKVARGGLRWSDRVEDFRTEVLGLVKAQQVKNSVIVPTGAKGGFVAKRLPLPGGREEMQKEGVACYQIFISALLDVTDNLVDNAVVPPNNVVRMDEDDTYMVVAADKGTATFSDIANAISLERNFWLGDAFASGGSVGYDHKKMGITAKGAWVSVQRHFREMGINVQTTDFTVVGIGDMGGDVFGNGMLLSEHIQLTAAFNHLHIFVDPNPDSASTYKERKRLFEMPRSTWDDFDKSLISKGGAVFSRAAKSIELTPEIKARFDIKEDRLTPNQFINAILKAPIDLLWNGGIGTYIKSSSESHADVGDKANDVLRVDGKDLRFKVIGEGGNLGCTQLGRIEYTMNGGRSNTDFIDNAGGVDCSDHEVNIKILLNSVVANGDMTEKQRNVLLEEMTDSVSELVLTNNYNQTGTISIAEFEAVYRGSEYQRLISSMESSGRLNRELEFLPSEEQITERRAAQKGLTRPELAVLVSYAKSQLKEELIDSDMPEDDYMATAIETAFPPRLSEEYRDQVYNHRLRREIISTQVANDMVNSMGLSFAHRLSQATRVDMGEVSRAYVLARDVFNMQDCWQQIKNLDYKVDSAIQHDMMSDTMHLIRRASRWFIRSFHGDLDVAKALAIYKPAVETLMPHIEKLMMGKTLAQWQKRTEKFTEAGAPDELASWVAIGPESYAVLGIAEAAEISGEELTLVAEVFFSLATQLEIDWLAYQVAKLRIENHWQAMARDSLRDELETQIRDITITALKDIDKSAPTQESVMQWIDSHQTIIARWRSMLVDLQATNSVDFAMYSVAMKELQELAERSKLSVKE